MPFEIGWYIPYRVIDERFWGKVTMDEMHQQTQAQVQMLTDGEIHTPDKRIHLLYDTTKAESVPPFYMTPRYGLPVLRFKNRGIVFHIANSSNVRSIIEVAAHITQFSLYTFTNREAAITALEALLLKEDLQVAK